MSAKSLAKPLHKKQADRLLDIDRKCRELRSKEMKKRYKITKDIVAKSPPKRKVRSKYLPSTVTDVVNPIKSISKNNASSATGQREIYKTEEEKAEIAGKSILGLSKANVFAKKLKSKTIEHNNRRKRTGKEDDGSVYVNPKHVALLRACGIRRGGCNDLVDERGPASRFVLETKPNRENIASRATMSTMAQAWYFIE